MTGLKKTPLAKGESFDHGEYSHVNVHGEQRDILRPFVDFGYQYQVNRHMSTEIGLFLINNKNFHPLRSYMAHGRVNEIRQHNGIINLLPLP